MKIEVIIERFWNRVKKSRTTMEAFTRKAMSTNQPVMVRIWSADDEKSEIHLMSSGNDYSICGHDAVGEDSMGDPVAHRRPLKTLKHFRRITCSQCLQIIADCQTYLERAK